MRVSFAWLPDSGFRDRLKSATWDVYGFPCAGLLLHSIGVFNHSRHGDQSKYQRWRKLTESVSVVGTEWRPIVLLYFLCEPVSVQPGKSTNHLQARTFSGPELPGSSWTGLRCMLMFFVVNRRKRAINLLTHRPKIMFPQFTGPVDSLASYHQGHSSP